MYCPVGWGCGMHWLCLCRGVGPPDECPGCGVEQSDSGVPVVLGLCGV